MGSTSNAAFLWRDTLLLICFLLLFLCCVWFYICPLSVLLLPLEWVINYKKVLYQYISSKFPFTPCGSKGSYFLECMALLRFHSFSVPSSEAVSSTAWLGWKVKARMASKWLRSVKRGFHVFLNSSLLSCIWQDTHLKRVNNQSVHITSTLDYMPCIDQNTCNYIHGEIVVIGNGEISQFTQVHVPSSNGIHNEDVRGETQGATCRFGGKKKSYGKISWPYK